MNREDIRLTLEELEEAYNMEGAANTATDKAKRLIAQALYEEFICPMCYIINPQHATADKGIGCKSCSDKEYWCGKT